jgi:hypothetical protein
MWWNAFRNIAIAISFIINFVLIVTLLIVVTLLFGIKGGILQPLVNGLYGSFVGLDQSTILTTIHVSDTVPVKLNIPLQTNTTVILTSDVPIRANASFNLPGGGGTINGMVNIVLPTGLKLPVSLDLLVPVNDKLPVVLNVPVNIRVQDTQLHDAISQLQSVLRPYVRLLGNLPDDWSGVPGFIGSMLNGNNLLKPNQFSDNAWPGFHTGLGTPVPTLPGMPTIVLATNTPYMTPQPGTPSTNAISTPNSGAPNTITPNPLITPNVLPAVAATNAPATPAPKPTNAADMGIITPTPH